MNESMIWVNSREAMGNHLLLLVIFILFIVTALLLEFLGNFHREQAEDSLIREATMIEKIVLDHDDRPLIPLLIHDILDEETNAIITDTSGTIIHSFHNGLNKERIENKVLSNLLRSGP